MMLGMFDFLQYIYRISTQKKMIWPDQLYNSNDVLQWDEIQPAL